MGSARSTLPHIRSAHTEDQEDVQDTRNTLPHIMSARTGDREEIRNTLPHTSSARTGEHVVFRDTHIRDEDDKYYVNIINWKWVGGWDKNSKTDLNSTRAGLY